MLLTKSYVKEKVKNNPYLFINLVFAFFPISFILGSFIINLNLLLLCCLGIYYLKSKVFTIKFDFPIKIIFLFFFILFVSTSFSFVKSLYFEEYHSQHLLLFHPGLYFEGYPTINLIRLIKSILFFRFFLLLVIVYLLSKFNILHFKYFFLTAAFSPILISLDIIYQFIFGFNIIGLESGGHHNRFNSGFFGDEFIAGGYLQRFAFFAIFFIIFILKNKNYTKYIFTAIVMCILGTGILFSGNRMPLILFIFGILLLFLFKLKIKKTLLVGLLALFVLLKFTLSSIETYKDLYEAFFSRAKNIVVELIPGTKIMTVGNRVVIDKYQKGEDVRFRDEKFRIGIGEMVIRKYLYTRKMETYHVRILLTAVDTWKRNKILGNGIKSFRFDCYKLAGPGVNFGEDYRPNVKNRLCSNHPHNYYFEILTETGIVGLFVTSIIALMFIIFIFKNFKFIKKMNIENFILLSAIISLILETIPLKSSGSLFTTNNATYMMLIGSIILSYKKLLKIKIE